VRRDRDRVQQEAGLSLIMLQWFGFAVRLVMLVARRRDGEKR
jgi:hypothetical protein